MTGLAKELSVIGCNQVDQCINFIGIVACIQKLDVVFPCLQSQLDATRVQPAYQQALTPGAEKNTAMLKN